jgi:hypothetical protein
MLKLQLPDKVLTMLKLIELKLLKLLLRQKLKASLYTSGLRRKDVTASRSHTLRYFRTNKHASPLQPHQQYRYTLTQQVYEALRC